MFSSMTMGLGNYRHCMMTEWWWSIKVNWANQDPESVSCDHPRKSFYYILVAIFTRCREISSALNQRTRNSLTQNFTLRVFLFLATILMHWIILIKEKKHKLNDEFLKFWKIPKRDGKVTTNLQSYNYNLQFYKTLFTKIVRWR